MSQKQIETLIRARYPLLYVVSHEEERVEAALAALAERRGEALTTWSITRGLEGGVSQKVQDPRQALAKIEEAAPEGLYVLRDFHPYLKDPAIVRQVRDLASALRRQKKTVVILSPVQEIPTELEKSILAVIRWELPDRDDVERIAREMLSQVAALESETGYSDDHLDAVIDAALGLTEVEVESVYAKSLVEKKRLDVPTIIAEKKEIIRKSGILEYYEPEEGPESVGGLDALKDWTKKRRRAFSAEAREFGLPLPKGMLLVGVPGTGKSLTAKAVAREWQMPLLRLDVGKVFGGLVGSSEENIRTVIQTAEAVAPAILWIDEIEKGFAGTGGGGDSGTSARVFGSFITWMQEKKKPVFIVATANDVSGLPPELLRKGRFDEIFFCDLPDAEERAEILRIHLERKGRNPAKHLYGKLAEKAEGFSGAELEDAVVQGLYTAFDEGRDLADADIDTALSETVPLSVTMEEKIAALREWAARRARSASAKTKRKPSKRGGAKKRTKRPLEVN